MRRLIASLNFGVSPVDALPAAGGFATSDICSPKLGLGEPPSPIDPDINVGNRDFKSPMPPGFTVARPGFNLPRVNQIPIASADFVTRPRRTTAVSCIELCRTPAR